MSDNLQKLLAGNWHERIDINQRAHSLTAEKFNNFHYAIGLPATILSAIAGATLLTKIDNPYVKITVGLIGLLAATLSGIQTFYSHAKRSEEHRAIAAQLGQIRREIEVLEKFPPNDKKTQAEMIKQISDRIAKIEESAPIVRSEIFGQLKGEKYKHVKKLSKGSKKK